ncbi:GMC family oxidoreductase [Microvirga ossetica]|nr:GMC family oxidoreductase N-terminal domain-containing protein [Microvirga ossetica]
MYDYVIVGAGSAGCVLAHRLVTGGASVLLLEAGGPDEDPLIRIPALPAMLQDTPLDWAYRTAPQAHLNGRRIFCPRGRVLGGSSTLNYLVYVRGNKGDFDQWAQLGNFGWSYDDVLPYFRRSERNACHRDGHHGTDGPIQVTDIPVEHPLTSLFLQAAAEAGLPFNEDFNGARQEGYGRYPVTLGADGRCSAATAYLRPVQGHRNLCVVTHARATRVLIEQERAVGVSYLTPEGLHTVHAACETILCGGAVNSPHLLMLSGVGAADELRAVGIELRHHLPGVGKNLQDHLSSKIRVEISEPLTLFGLSQDARTAAQQEYLENGTGPFATNYFEAGAFFSSDPFTDYPDTQLIFTIGFGSEMPDGCATDRHGFVLSAYPTRPDSRGEVRAVTSNPLDRPLIDPRYLSAPHDLDLALESFRMMRRIAAAPAFSGVGAREVHPGDTVADREGLTAYIRRTASTSFHQSGTCRMGTDEMAVVDPALRLHGLEALRVVDASVMPTLVSGNTNAATMMIAEKAADLILTHDSQHHA